MAKNIEDFTDEELANMTPEQFAAEAVEPAPATEGGGESQELTDKEAEEYGGNPPASEKQQQQSAKEDGNGDDDVEAQAKATERATADKGGKEAPAEKQPAEAKEPEAGKQAKVDEQGKPKEEEKPAEAAALNYEEEHKKLLAPFKANGRDIQVQNVDEARQLMQMGANYSKKMAALKPQLAILRMLDNAKVDADALGFLIDVHRKDPAAINKLVKDSGIDPMDLSADKAEGYKPGNHMPSEAEVNLEAVLNELEGSSGFRKTLEVANGFDAKSKQILSENPDVLKAINQHIELGAYDLTMAEVDRRRMLGQLSGLPDLEAYRQVGNELQASGKFAHLGAGQPVQSQQAPVAPAAAKTDPKKAEDESKRNEARRAIAPVKGAAPAGKTLNPDFNPLSMSDEEFAKLGGKF